MVPIRDPETGTWPSSLPAVPPLPDSAGFVAPSVPSPIEALSAFLRALGRDVDGGRRVLARAAWLLGIAVLCLPPHMLCRTLGWPSAWNRRFMRWATRACGIRVETVGKPLQREVFYIANHLSWTDALILGGVTGTAFVAQHGIALWPGLNFLCRMNDTIFVNRTERLRVDEQVATLRAQFAVRSTLALFAEGTTSDGRRLLPFKASLLAMLVPPPRRASVQPVVVDCDEAGRELAWIGMETGAQNAWRLLARRGTWRVRVHFLEPFDPAQMPDRKALAAHARNAILARLSATLHG